MKDSEGISTSWDGPMVVDPSNRSPAKQSVILVMGLANVVMVLFLLLIIANTMLAHPQRLDLPSCQGIHSTHSESASERSGELSFECSAYSEN